MTIKRHKRKIKGAPETLCGLTVPPDRVLNKWKRVNCSPCLGLKPGQADPLQVLDALVRIVADLSGEGMCSVCDSNPVWGQAPELEMCGPCVTGEAATLWE